MSEGFKFQVLSFKFLVIKFQDLIVTANTFSNPFDELET